MAMTQPAGAKQKSVDGRRERSVSSRAKIVAAMLDLVEGGDVQPSAARVAEAAGVGLRTVFRHFDDMDSLYREMSEAIEARVLPVMLRPFTTGTWREQMRELAARRCEVFEAILPYRITASLKRFQSTFLMQDYRRMLRMERSSIDAILPASVHADPVQLSAVHLSLSFQCWRVLRHDQELGIDAARAVFLRLADAVLEQSKG
ncbi:TetR/AcrR family transcriptional regulator [Sphingomonas sp. So64.6b]|uniref:TetR/AcrR family transcriptional regulator n=1 Tax=Sphingomonas sp. So64.6b TaxID=2997354 RepID=UPI001FCF1E1B|nr:TetR/AcrR family transcriptional regulator [Sphingomonas sp. So64.6b]